MVRTIMGGWEFFYWKWGEARNVGFKMGRWGILPPYFTKKPLYCPLPFFKFCLPPPSPTPLFCHLQPLHPLFFTPTVLSIALLLWLNGWSRHIWCAILFGDNSGSTHVEHCYLSTRRTLICVLCNKASSLLRPGT